MKILAIILARKGSKRIKHKNKVILKKKRQIEKKMTILCISKKNILNQDVLRYIISYL